MNRNAETIGYVTHRNTSFRIIRQGQEEIDALSLRVGDTHIAELPLSDGDVSDETLVKDIRDRIQNGDYDSMCESLNLFNQDNDENIESELIYTVEHEGFTYTVYWPTPSPYPEKWVYVEADGEWIADVGIEDDVYSKSGVIASIEDEILSGGLDESARYTWKK